MLNIKQIRKKIMKKQTIISILIGVLLFIGLTAGAAYWYQSSHKKTVVTEQVQTNSSKTNDNKTITYKGVAGSTALALLQKAATIKTSGTGENAFVTTINGVTADSKSQYWSFDVNGEAATVGAGSYITKDSDTITWKLISFYD